jgi:hypothetical protein
MYKYVIMALRHSISQIINIPTRLHLQRGASFVSLLQEVGYFEIADQINEAGIFEAVSQNPNVVDSWLSLSADKRSSSGWYFLKNESNNYVVGYYPENSVEQLKYTDGDKAYAAFIVRELEEIRKRHLNIF